MRAHTRSAAWLGLRVLLVVPRRRFAAALLPGLLWLAIGCAPEPHKITPSAYPTAGLYTPGNTLGASDPTDTRAAGAGLGNRCVALGGTADAGASASTAGTLRVEYLTQTQKGRYAPKNCSAVWLETVDGQYVATLEIAAGLRRPGLVYWQDHACTEKPGPDVVTSATLPDHMKPHVAMWKGADFDGGDMPDGPYKLFIEVTESDKEPGEIETFDVAKGPTPSSLEAPVTADGPLQHVSITWSLMKAGTPGGAASGK